MRAVELKFCGLTRPEDAALAGELAADYAGVIFAGGPRDVAPERARQVLAPLAGTAVRTVGVFGDRAVEDIARIAGAAGVDVIQLHGGASAGALARLRALFSGRLWVVFRMAGSGLPQGFDELASLADAVLLDAAVSGRLGGSGMALDWLGVGAAVRTWRGGAAGGTPLVLAGGLRPDNVRRAVTLVQPDVVDVSSGVERSPGVKDPQAMRAFAAAVRAPLTTER